jgi:hypothetical protein
MTALLILAAIATLLPWAFAWAQSRSQAAYIGRLHDEHNRERGEWTRERQLLLNRIKPETAQFVTPDEVAHMPPAVRFDDDEDYWASQETREEMAERLAREELEARLAPALDEDGG